MATKQRLHREQFRTVSCGGRKSCPSCKKKLGNGESIWSWGEYLYGKRRTVDYFCKECFPEIRQKLVHHAGGCGCQFELVGYQGTVLPSWLTLEERPVVTIKKEESKMSAFPSREEQLAMWEKQWAMPRQDMPERVREMIRQEQLEMQAELWLEQRREMRDEIQHPVHD
jgi:hypothetical protein